MPKILESEALTIARSIDQAPETDRPWMLDLLDRYQQQQRDEGEPDWPSVERARMERENNLRSMFEAPDKITYDPGPFSQNPQEAKMLHANMALLSARYQKEPAEVASRYDFLLNDYARQKLGASEDVDTAKFYALAQKDMQRIKLREDTQREGMSAALRGEDGVKALAAWQAKNADRAKDDAGLFMRGYQQALEQDGEMLPIADRLLKALESGADKTGQNVQANMDRGQVRQELGQMVEQLAGMKKAQRKSVYRSIAARIEAAGYDQKGFWSQMLGELDKGLYRMEGTLGTQAGQAADVMSNFPAMLAEGMTGNRDFGMTPAETAQTDANLARRERIGNVQEEILQIVSGELDPVRPTTGWMNETLETGLIKGPGAVAPFMAASALLGPYGAGLVFTADFAEQNRRELVQSGLDADQARKVGVMAAPLQAAVESLSNMVSLGKFPAVQAALPRFTRPVGGASLVGRYVQNSLISGATEFTEEQIQDNLVVPVMQELLGALEKDVPEVDWSFYKTRAANSTPELAATLLPMALVFGGVMTAADAKLSRTMTQNVELMMSTGMDQAQAVDVASQPTQEQRIRRGAELWSQRKGTKASMEEAQKKLADQYRTLAADSAAAVKELEARGVLPRLLPMQGGEYRLTFNDGSTADFKTREEALGGIHVYIRDRMQRSTRALRETIDTLTKNLEQGREFALEISPEAMPADEAVKRGIISPQALQERAAQGAILDATTLIENSVLTGKALGDEEAPLMLFGMSKNEWYDKEGRAIGMQRIKDDILRTTMRLWDGASPLTLIEEKTEGDAKVILSTPGKRQWMLDHLRAYEDASGDKLFTSDDNEQINDKQLIEAWSHMAQSYFVAAKDKVKGRTLGRYLRDIEEAELTAAMQGRASWWQAVVNRAQKLGELKAAGKLNEDVVAELEKQLGIDSQVKHEQGAMQEAQNVANEVAQEASDWVDDSEFAGQVESSETFSISSKELRSKIDSSPDLTTLGELGITEGFHANHGEEFIPDFAPRASKQGRKGQYAGFYLGPALDEVRQYGQNVTTFPLNPNMPVKILRRPGQVERITPEMIKEWRDEGVGVVVGPAIISSRIEIATLSPSVLSGETFSLRVTPAQDADHMAAVEAGDMETAQRLADEAAKVAGFQSVAVIHSTNAEFNTFGRVRKVATARGKIDTVTTIKSSGVGLIYATQNAAYSALFGDKQLKLYHNISNPADLRSLGAGNVSDSEFDGLLTSLGINHKPSAAGMAPVFERLNKGQHKKAMIEAGFDGFVLREKSGDLEADAIAGFDSSQFKSADPVTFDESGNVIPLSQRFNPADDRITYSLRVTPAQDAAYMAAVEAGDMEKAQRMVDEAARKIIASNPRNVVKLGRFLSKSEYESAREQIEELPREVFYVGNVEVIRNPTGDDIRGMTNEERAARGGRRSVDPDTRFTKDNYGNTWRWKATGGMHSMIEPSISRREGVDVNQNNDIPYHSDLVKDAIRSGAYIPSKTLAEYPNYADFVKPSSADPVTRDESGNVIPLSQRFNPADDRITYSLRVTPAQDAEYMASASGAAQTPEPLPGGLSEAEVRKYAATKRARAKAAEFIAAVKARLPTPEQISERFRPIIETNFPTWKTTEKDNAISILQAYALYGGTSMKVPKPLSSKIYKGLNKELVLGERQAGWVPTGRLEHVAANILHETLLDEARKLGIFVDYARTSSRYWQWKDAETGLWFKLLRQADHRPNESAYSPAFYDTGHSMASFAEINPSFESSGAAGGTQETFSLRPGDFASRVEAMFSPFQRSPEARLIMTRVAKSRALKLGQQVFEASIRTMGSIDREARVRAALAEDKAVQDYLDGLTPAARQTLEWQPADLQDDPLVAAMLDFGKLMSKTTALQRGKLDLKMGDFDGAPWLPPSFYSKGAGIMPDQMAQAMFDAGLLPDAYTDTLWSELSKRIEATRKDKAAHREAVQAFKDAKKAARDAASKEADKWADNAKKQAGSGKAQRDRIKAWLRVLDGILAASPPEVRARVGGFVKMAGIATDEAALRYLEDRVAKLDKELEKYLVKQARGQLERIFDKARPKSDAGEKAKGKLTPELHAWFKLAEEAAKLSPAVADERIQGIEQSLVSDMTDAIKQELSAWLGRPVTDDAEAQTWQETRLTLFQTFGAVMYGTDAKSERNAAEITAALDAAREAYQTGRLAHIEQLAKLREKRAEDRGDGIQRVGSPYDPNKANTRKKALNKATGLKGRALDYMDTGLDASGFFLDLLGDDTATDLYETTRRNLLEAAATKADNMEKRKADFAAMLKQVFPGKGLVDRLRGLWELQQIQENAPVGTMSQLQAMQFTLWHLDPDSREWLATNGYGDEWQAKAEQWLTAEAKAVRAWLLKQYDGQYDRLNPVFRRLRGVNLPRVEVYGGKRQIEHSKSDSTASIEADMMRGGMDAGFTKTRVSRPTGRPRMTDALQNYWQNALQVEHYIAFAETVTELKAVFGHRDFLGAVETNRGLAKKQQVLDWISNIETAGTRDAFAHSMQGKLFGRYGKAVSASALLFKLGTLAKQSPAAIQSAFKVGLKEYFTSLSRILAGKGAISLGDMYRSDTVQRRLSEHDSEMLQASKGWNQRHFDNEILDKAAIAPEVMMNAGWYAIGWTDARFTTISAAVAYDVAFRDGKKLGMTDDEAKAFAANQADLIVMETAQPQDVVTKSLSENMMPQALLRLVFAFQSANRQVFGLTYLAAKQGKVANAYAVAALIAAMTQTIGGIMRMMFSDDDPEELFDPQAYALGMATAPLTGMVGLGPLVEFGLNFFGVESRFSPSSAAAAKSLQDIVNGEADTKDVGRVVSMAGAALGGRGAMLGVGWNVLNQIMGLYENVTANE